ncbi:ankyrin repeat domain-containing protein [Nitrosomonas sp.]|uniref:ankyrin repeat domain-containing protein n=1 Tax=Nitrosomonas sp. TaxID=42353 RepID=UPI001D1FCC35|nr:ankyrin repeat domain-containing protein [Nitrosomonas sp.]MBX3617443.1 ankyrin repeat domain-containing protein [Nitrosomonas sp.]
MKADNNRKYLLIFSAILIGFQYFGLELDGNIPFTQVRVSSHASIPFIFIVLILFFGVQFVYYWLTQKSDRSLFEFITAIVIAFFAISPVLYDYFKNYPLDWKVITTVITVLLLGFLLAITVDFIIFILFSLRSVEEMKKMGLGRVPSASKALIRSLFLLIPLNVGIIISLIKYEHLLPIISPNNHWITIFIIPTILINTSNFLNLLLCLGPQKIRKKALDKLRRFRKATDLHEMHYQFIGIENLKNYEIIPICAFAKNGELKKVKELLLSGIDPNSQDPRGWSPLMYATAEKHIDIVKLLLEYGADPNIVNYLGRSAIMYAANYGFYEIAKVLLENKATPNISGFTDLTPLSAAADKGHLEVVKLLVEFGADVTYKNKENKTALDIAMESKQGEVAKLLRTHMLKLDDTRPEDKTNLIKNLSWIDKDK